MNVNISPLESLFHGNHKSVTRARSDVSTVMKNSVTCTWSANAFTRLTRKRCIGSAEDLLKHATHLCRVSRVEIRLHETKLGLMALARSFDIGMNPQHLMLIVQHQKRTLFTNDIYLDSRKGPSRCSADILNI